MTACSPASGDPARGGSQASSDTILDWRLDLAWSVGGAADTSLILATFRSKDLAVTNGTLLLVDRDRARIARYSSDGERLSPIGNGEGAGPGELTFPGSVAVDSRGRIIVDDRGNGRISFFEADGRFVGPQPHESPRSISRLRAVTDSSLIGLVVTRDSITLAILTETRLRTIASIGAPRRLGTAPVCSTLGYEFDALFSPTILFATSGSVLAFTTGEGVLSLFRGARPLTKLEHTFPRRRTSKEMARAHLGEGIRIHVQGMPPCLVPSAMILDVAEFERELPPYGSLAVDPDGLVWATRYAIGREPAFADVFHAEAGYVGTVAVGAARPVAFLDPSLMVSLEADDDEVPVVRVYHVTR